MSFKRKLFTLATLALFTLILGTRQLTHAAVPTTLWSEDFETDGSGTRYTPSEECTDASGDFFTRSDGTNIGSFVVYNSPNNSNYWAAMDTNGDPCTSASEDIVFQTFDITGYSSFEFLGLFAEDDSTDGAEDWDADASVSVEYQIDGGAWTEILRFEAAGDTNTEPHQDTDFDGIGDGAALTPDFSEFSANFSGSGSLMQIRVRVENLEAGDEDIAFDYFRVTDGVAAPANPEVLLTEIIVSPTVGEAIEIYNPTSDLIDLSDFYLTDATYSGGGTYYYNIVTGTNAGGGGFGDFHARFPDGAIIASGEYQTLSFAGSDDYFATYGTNPTYELYEDGASPDGIPDMREALPGSINGQGGLSDSGEVVILYQWDGASDLVLDMDYVVWGDKVEAVDKTGVSIDGPDADADASAYQNDTAIAVQDVVAGGAHAADNSWQRDDLTEGAEIATGGNGVNGEDETSEDLSNTWCDNVPTLGAANDCTPPPMEGWVINEIHADPAADLPGDANGDGVRDASGDEFVEIVNNTGADVDISGWTLSDDDAAGVTVPDGTILPNQCALVVFGGGSPTGSFGGSLVLVDDGSIGTGLSNSGDVIVFSDGVTTQATATYGSEGGNDQSLTLDPDVTGSLPYVLHSTASTSGGALFSPGTKMDGTPFAENCFGATEVKIHEIQGNGLDSPLVGDKVIIEGVVVGDFQDFGQFGGFHVQEEDADADTDPLTSEGIFVYHYSTAVALGDVVQVTGTVTEYNGLTELTSVSDVTILSSGASVTPAAVSLPVASMDDLEAYEGMSVIFPQALTISEYFNFDRYGEMVLSVDRQFQPTAVYDPGSPEATALAEANELARIILDDGSSDQNTDPARHPNGLDFDLTNLFRGGDQVQNLVGVMDYAFGSYKIQPTAGADFIPQNPRTLPHDDVGGSLKVASFNVLNYFTTLGSRGADDLLEFDRQRTKIIAAITDINADIVGLIEIENNTDAIVDLVTGLNDLLGPDTYAYIDTGVIGTDEIKVAFIYKPATVTAVGAYAVLDSSVDPLFNDDKNRPVLAQTFEDNNGGMITVAVNHLKSKGSSCDDIGDPDTGDGAGNCNLTRTAAAEALVNWLASDPTSSGDADFLIIGDLNSYDKEDPIDAILAGGYTDLLQQFQGEYAYSYVFDGQLGYLDHALANPELLAQVTGTTVWHINADEPDLLDYDMTYKQDAQDALYEPNAYRSSDHDPVIVGLQLEGDDVYISSNSDGLAGDIAYADEDILFYDLGVGEWVMHFDGSDVGIKATDLDAMHLMEDGSILMSFAQRINVAGFGKVDDSDIVKFTPTMTGADTAGTFEMYFDGSDVGLKKSGEDVDAIGFTPDGRLIVSTNAAFIVPQTGGGKLFGDDDDLIVLNGVLGADTTGDWEVYLDGSDVWHFAEDVWGTWLDAETGDIYLSMQNEFTAGDVSGDQFSIFVCQPVTLGSSSECVFEMYFNTFAAGFSGDRIDGFAIVK